MGRVPTQAFVGKTSTRCGSLKRCSLPAKAYITQITQAQMEQSELHLKSILMAGLIAAILLP
jgi:hypothetical protein